MLTLFVLPQGEWRASNTIRQHLLTRYGNIRVIEYDFVEHQEMATRSFEDMASKSIKDSEVICYLDIRSSDPRLIETLRKTLRVLRGNAGKSVVVIPNTTWLLSGFLQDADYAEQLNLTISSVVLKDRNATAPTGL